MKKTFCVILIFCFFIYFALPGQSSEKLIKRAQKDMDLMNYSQAIENLEQALQDKPKKKDIRSLLAFACWKRHRLEEAIKALEEEIHLFPDNWNACILLGYIQFSEGLNHEAFSTFSNFEKIFESFMKKEAQKKKLNVSNPQHRAKLLQKIIEKSPNIGLPSFLLGYVLKNQGRLDDASKFFKEAHLRGYDPVDCFIQLVDLELVREDWQAALGRIEEALVTAGDQPEFDMLRGYTLYRLNREDEAVLSLEAAVKGKHYLPEARKNLAKIYYMQQDFAKSASLLKTVLKISSPFDFEASYLLERALKERFIPGDDSQLLLSKELTEEVQLKYSYIFEMNLKTVVEHINASALSLIKSGRLYEARQILRNFLSLNDSFPELHYNLAQISNTTKALGEALEHAWKATQIKPDYRDAWDLLGNILFKVGDFQRALEAYDKALQMDPKDPMAHFNLACVYLALDDFSRSKEHFEQTILYEHQAPGESEEHKASKDDLDVSVVVLSRPLSFESHKALGKIYLQQKQKEKALEEFEEAIALEPSDPESYYEAGNILLDQKNKSKAVSYFEKYVYLGGKKEDEVQELLKKIK